MAPDREYKVETSSRQCSRCDRRFAVGDEYYSAVTETAEEDRLARCDFCPACWAPADAYFSFWKTRVPEPKEEPAGPRFIDLERLLAVFERLADAEDPQGQRFRYVLALVLMRKRRLRLVSSRRLAGRRGEELTLRQVGLDREHTVTSPGLSEEEILSVAGRLREILDMPDHWDAEEAGETDAP
jgi:hypothetical protein